MEPLGYIAGCGLYPDRHRDRTDHLAEAMVIRAVITANANVVRLAMEMKTPRPAIAERRTRPALIQLQMIWPDLESNLT